MLWAYPVWLVVEFQVQKRYLVAGAIAVQAVWRCIIHEVRLSPNKFLYDKIE